MGIVATATSTLRLGNSDGKEGVGDGGRRYFYEIIGRYGWKARYIKEVDASEKTVKFYQEIFNEEGKRVEIHEKYPVDRGHRYENHPKNSR